jgi:hypothetical protein
VGEGGEGVRKGLLAIEGYEVPVGRVDPLDSLYACALRPGEFRTTLERLRRDNSDQLRIDEALGKSGLDDPKI